MFVSVLAVHRGHRLRPPLIWLSSETAIYFGTASKARDATSPTYTCRLAWLCALRLSSWVIDRAKFELRQTGGGDGLPPKRKGG